MRMQGTNPRRSGFALVELLAVVLVAVLVACVLLVMGDSARRTARLNEDFSNLRRIGTLTRSYGADFNDRVWALSWRQGNYTTHWPDMQTPSLDALVHGARQAVAIMREKGGGNMSTMPIPNSWIPHVGYSHLVLQDYSGEALPASWFISHADRARLLWAVHESCASTTACGCPASTTYTYRWRFSASFVMPLAFYDQSPAPYKVYQSTLGMQYYQSNDHSRLELHGFQLSDIDHPSGKVMVHDTFTRHFGARQPVLILAEARIPLLLSDGSAAVQHSAGANPGAQPNGWFVQGPYNIAYSPGGCWEPPAIAPGGTDVGAGRYRWTRMGIRGRDVGGSEIWP
jgi:hypothetical protein